MTKNDKEKLYNLLKKTSQFVYGYTTSNFEGEMPSFSDEPFKDERFKEKSFSTQNSTQNSAQNAQSVHSTQTVDETNLSAQNFNEDKENKNGTSLDSIYKKINECSRCRLCQTRTTTVPGVGVEHPLVLVIGEGPGHDEDLKGEPFVGQAGQLLDKMLASISLSRTQNCYIANIVKCRPPQNRDPYPDEIESCISFLDAQIALLKPKMILLMGRIAGQTIFKTSNSINSFRGQILNFKGIPTMATYHPSALLRNQALKAPAWQDLKGFRAELEKLAPNYQLSFVKE